MARGWSALTGGGPGPGDYLIEILDQLDGEMYELFLAYATEATAAWEELVGGGNSGQSVIVERNVLPTVYEHLALVRERWPRGAGAEEYLEVVSNCYDPEVMERAFGDTIMETYQNMQEYQYEAEEWQWEHDVIAGMLGAVPYPHSVAMFWKGNPF